MSLRLCSALAKSGRSVLHVDEASYYGGPEASLSLSELVEWTHSSNQAKDGAYNAIELSFAGGGSLPPEALLRSSRQYNLSLCPALAVAVSPFVDTLVRSGVARYTGFKLLDGVGIYDAAAKTLKRTAATKEDIFNDKSLSLVEKRKLVNLIKFASTPTEAQQTAGQQP